MRKARLQTIHRNIADSIALKTAILQDQVVLDQIEDVAHRMVQCYQRRGKIMFCGNGGSAADAQHLAAELSGRYYYDRPPLFAEALHVNTSYLTAVANDYSYEKIYSRMMEAVASEGDMLIGFSTSGNSANIIDALKVARANRMVTVGLTGRDGGEMKGICDVLIKVPSTDTPRIQECHMLIGHTVCEIVERELFPRQ